MICTEPTMSEGRGLSPPQRGISFHASGQTSSTTGTLIRNTDPHQKYSSSRPPTTGPMAAPPEATEAQMPIASARSRSSVKTWRTMDSVAGIIIAAPTARNTRAAISHSAVGENAAHSDATANTGSPARNSRLWPMRSLSMPAPGSRPATTSG